MEDNEKNVMFKSNNSENINFPHNDLTKLLETFPKKKWFWSWLSANPNISWEYISTHLQFPWERNGVSANPNITLDIIKNNPTICAWNWYDIYKNPNIIPKNIDPETRMLNGYQVNRRRAEIQNPNVSEEMFTKQDILSFIDYRDVALKMNISLKVIKEMNIDGWYYYLAQNPNLFKNENDIEIFLADIENMPYHKVYYAKSLSLNPKISWNIIKKHPKLSYKHNLNWNWGALSDNPNITWKIICENPDIPWFWNKISKNPSITWDIICENPSHTLKQKFGIRAKWNLRSFSYNPNLTYEIVISNPKLNWNWKEISRNKFKKHPFLVEKRREIYRKILLTVWEN